MVPVTEVGVIPERLGPDVDVCGQPRAGEGYRLACRSGRIGPVRGQGHVASLKYELEPLMLKTDWTINLGVIVTEWVTNAFKYAYPEKPGEVRVRLRKLTDGKAELSVEDDGIGRAEGPAKGTGLGSRIVNAMARSLGADVEYIASGRGTVARLAFAAGTEG